LTISGAQMGGRAAEFADPNLRVSTQGVVFTAGDYLCAYVLEWTLHHLDLSPRLTVVAPSIAYSVPKVTANLNRSPR